MRFLIDISSGYGVNTGFIDFIPDQPPVDGAVRETYVIRETYQPTSVFSFKAQLDGEGNPHIVLVPTEDRQAKKFMEEGFDHEEIKEGEHTILTRKRVVTGWFLHFDTLDAFWAFYSRSACELTALTCADEILPVILI